MKIKKCRICKQNKFIDLFSLGSQPPANNLLTSKEEKTEFYPLNVRMCSQCGLVQLSDLVPAEKLFSKYNYMPSVSEGLRFHFRSLAKEVTKKFKLSKDDLVIDIGSNDGLLLSELKKLNVKVLGIEPAVNIAKLAIDTGVPTINSFFSFKLVRELSKKHKKAKVITATNVLAHVHDIRDFVQGIKLLLEKGGVFIAEVPYLPDLIQKNEFDTIYHEHLSYFSLKPLVSLFSDLDMTLYDAELIRIHGGSIRIFVTNEDKSTTDNVRELIEIEERNRIYQTSTYEEFFRSISGTASKLKAYISGQKKNGKRVIGIGAAAKATVALNFTGLDSNIIDYVVDNTSYKQGKFIPGVNIPIYPEEKFYFGNPDIAIILAWNHSAEIIQKHSQFLKKGGTFVIPIPDLRIIS